MKEGLKSVSVLFPLQWYTLDGPCLGNYKVVFERTESMSRHSTTVTSRNVFFLPLLGSANVKSAFVLRGIHGRETSLWTNGKQGIHICLQLMTKPYRCWWIWTFFVTNSYFYLQRRELATQLDLEGSFKKRQEVRFVQRNPYFFFSLSPLHLFRPMKIAWRLRTGKNLEAENNARTLKNKIAWLLSSVRTLGPTFCNE